ncbi:MAG: hypothetical protein HZB61_11815 [Nitrospirae bacterium]|nr:hypothetical protein [Nitrospirota bacterium]
MEKYFGISLFIISLVVAFWGIYSKQSKAAVIFFCLFSSFLGLIFLLYDRLIEITIENVGSIKAAQIQAKTDADVISELKRRIGNQAETIDLIAEQASNAEKMFEDLAKKNSLAGKKIDELNVASQKASKSLINIQSATEFITAFLNAENDETVSLTV